MAPPALSPLDGWIARRIGLGAGAGLTRAALGQYQLDRLRHSLAQAARSSPFYRRLFSGASGLDAVDFKAFAALPFTTAADLARDPLAFLCVSQSEVARVVTLCSSGTSGQPKRVFFDAADLERTVDFFHHGMSTFVRAGQRVLILLPGRAPGSVGDLLVEGLARLGATGFVHGPLRDPAAAIDEILARRADSLVGIPVQVLTLVRHVEGARIPRGTIRSVLLSTDYVPAALAEEIERTWGCRVYQHYGMTEMGYGGGVECDARDGYHLRETDLLVEIIDPATGQILPDGVSGEVVVTTLIRRAMPLIRYRTGDAARFLTGDCTCGSALRRLGKIAGRLADGVALDPAIRLRMADLDEAIFAVPGVLDFQAELTTTDGASRLGLTIHCDTGRFPDAAVAVRAALVHVPAVRGAVARGRLDIGSIRMRPAGWFTTGAAKRRLIDRRQEISIT
ncbi:MAG: DVU_1553 family AMP-dependent CoA ligase [Desulfobacterales bacterium]